MNYTWFKIVNVDEFEALELPSFNYRLFLDGKGLFEVLVTKGNELGVKVNEVFLMPELNNTEKFFAIDGMASYVDSNNDLFVGFEV
jgi:hypothetical protein